MARALTALALLGLAPFAAFLNDNRADARISDVLPWALATVLPALALVLAVRRIKGRQTAGRFAAALGGVVYLFFSFHLIAPDYEYPLAVWAAALLLWASAAALVAAGLWRFARRDGALTAIALIAALMCGFPAAHYALFRAHSAFGAQKSSPSEAFALSRPRVRPNVYFFLVDAYSRADVLARVYHYDNSPFLGALHARGFQVARAARSDYLVTKFSVPSILDMDYLRVGTSNQPLAPNEFQSKMRGDSRTVATFRRLGYRYVQAPSSWPDDACSGHEDLCVDPVRFGGRIAFNEATWAILRSTPLAALGKSSALTGVAEGMPVHVAQVLAEKRVARPFFAYAHILLAHPPWLFRGPSCRYINQPRALSVSGPEERTAYVAAVRCANSQLLRAVDLIRRNDPSAVIVLQADHGAGVGLDWQMPRWKWPAAAVDERSSPLAALRLPPRCRHSVPDALAAVNTMRVVFNCIADGHLRLLPTRRFVSNPDLNVLREWRGVSAR